MQARQLVQERLAIAAPIANLGGPARFDATPVIDRPHHEDRDFLERTLRDRSVDDHLLEDQGALAGCTRRCQCGDLGRADQNAAGAGRSGTVGELWCPGRRGHADHLGHPGCRDDAVFEWIDHRHRRVSRNP